MFDTPNGAHVVYMPGTYPGVYRRDTYPGVYRKDTYQGSREGIYTMVGREPLLASLGASSSLFWSLMRSLFWSLMRSLFWSLSSREPLLVPERESSHTRVHIPDILD